MNSIVRNRPKRPKRKKPKPRGIAEIKVVEEARASPKPIIDRHGRYVTGMETVRIPTAPSIQADIVIVLVCDENSLPGNPRPWKSAPQVDVEFNGRTLCSYASVLNVISRGHPSRQAAILAATGTVRGVLMAAAKRLAGDQEACHQVERVLAAVDRFLAERQDDEDLPMVISPPDPVTSAPPRASSLPAESARLSERERAELDSLERAIAIHLRDFLHVGRALAEIQSRKLYRETHATFEAYCRERWDFGRQHAYRLIASAEVIGQLSPIGDGGTAPAVLPATESQARPLARVEPEKRLEVWQRAVQRAPKDPAGRPQVTAAIVEEAVREAAASSRADRPGWAQGPSPRERAANDAARRWSENLRRLYTLLTSLRDAGGVKALARHWDDARRSHFAEELRRIAQELSEQVSILEESRATNPRKAAASPNGKARGNGRGAVPPRPARR